ncbi:MAG TPA: hypothetical protein ENK32_04650, partial [Anaerolineae bacterium]|nr:hypothetical protein [Anaerolineae bacterium]
MNIGRQNSLTPIESQTIPAKGEDLRLRLLRLYLLFAAVLLAGMALLVWLASSRLQAEWTAAEQTLTANLAARLSQSPDLGSFANNLDVWLSLTGADEAAIVTVLGENGQELFRREENFALPDDVNWSAWQWRVYKQAQSYRSPNTDNRSPITDYRTPSASFITQDPELNKWLHTVTAV